MGDNVKTTSGAKFEIGSNVAADNLSEFEADTYAEVGEVENYGEFGDEANIVNFLSVAAGRNKKIKGSFDAGTFPLVVGRDSQDAGQAALVAAAATKYNYNIRVTLADKPSDLYSDTVFYFRAVVGSARNQLGGADDVTKRTFSIAINSEILEIEPALLSP